MERNRGEKWKDFPGSEARALNSTLLDEIKENCASRHTWMLQMDLTVTLSMITLSVSRTFGSMTQLEPMVQFLMVVFSDITLPSPTKHSDPNWKRNPIESIFEIRTVNTYTAVG